MDPRANPYLAHHYEEPAQSSYGNGYRNGYATNGHQKGAALANFKRHETTAAMAKLAEDGPQNPFNSTSLSTEYFNILKVRRTLPVHAQR